MKLRVGFSPFASSCWVTRWPATQQGRPRVKRTGGNGSKKETSHICLDFLLPRVSWQIKRPLRAFSQNNLLLTIKSILHFQRQQYPPNRTLESLSDKPLKISILLTNIHTLSLFINIFHLFSINVFITVYKWEIRFGSHMCSSAVSEGRT